jgi:hypothetical protein
MAQVFRPFVQGTSNRRSLIRSPDDRLDSVSAIVGWTLLTVLAFWAPVAFVAYMLAS